MLETRIGDAYCGCSEAMMGTFSSLHGRLSMSAVVGLPLPTPRHSSL